MNDKIKHVFVVMFENRSFDHILGFSGLKGTDAVTGEPTEIDGLKTPEVYKTEYPLGSGKFVQPTPDAPNSLENDPPHEFLSTLEQLCGKDAIYSEGKYPLINNSGFATSYSTVDSKNVAVNMKCFAPKDLPIINQLATEFAVCDKWFSSIPGPTWPNRFFLHAGTSGGMDDSPVKRIMKYADFMENLILKMETFLKPLMKKEYHG